jgi:hypothetical protein
VNKIKAKSKNLKISKFNRRFYLCSICEEVVAVHLAGGAPDTRKALLKELQKGGPDKVNSSSYRWAVGALQDGQMEFQLQVIPLPAKDVKSRPLLSADNVAVSVLKSWRIKGPVFNRQAGLKGPVPVLFSTNPDELGKRLGG